MLISWARNAFVALTFAVAFVINPAYVTGCASEDEDSQKFSEAEMVALLEDLTTADRTEFDDGDARYAIELSLEQAEGEDAVSSRQESAFASTAYACGSRTFMKSAAACDSVTTMPVEGTLTLLLIEGDARTEIFSAPVEGSMLAGSQYLTSATVSVEFDGGEASWTTENGMDFELDWFRAEGVTADGGDVTSE